MKWFGRKESKKGIKRRPSKQSQAKGKRLVERLRPMAKRLEPYLAGLRSMRSVVWILGPLAAGVALFWMATALGSSSGLFQAAEIELKGNNHVERKALLAVAGLEPAPNLLAIDLNEVSSRILSEPWIEGVKLVRHLPNRLEVEVVERHGAAVVATSRKDAPSAVLVDSQGVVLRAARAEDSELVPVVVGVKGQVPSPGTRFTDPSVVSGLEVLRVTEGLPLVGRSSLAVVDCSYPGRIVLKGRKSEAVVVVRGGNLERKFARLRTLAAELKRRHRSIRYIDLSFNHRVIVKGTDKET